MLQGDLRRSSLPTVVKKSDTELAMLYNGGPGVISDEIRGRPLNSHVTGYGGDSNSISPMLDYHLYDNFGYVAPP